MKSLIDVPKIKLPSDGTWVPIPFSKKPLPAEEKKEPGKGESQTTAEEKEEKEEKATPLERTLLLVVTDEDTRRATIQRVNLMPQRPIRYVQPRVGYNINRELNRNSSRPAKP